MAHYDTKFLIILIVIILIVLFFVILYVTGQKVDPHPQPKPPVKPPPECPVPSAVNEVYAVIVPGIGTIVSWSASSGATEFTVYKGTSSVSKVVFEQRVSTTDDYLWFADVETPSYYFVCPSNPCGEGQCSDVLQSKVIV